MNLELLARAELFAAIEGGSEFWTNEITISGAQNAMQGKQSFRAAFPAPPE